jgi:hypothetical protein
MEMMKVDETYELQCDPISGDYNVIAQDTGQVILDLGAAGYSLQQIEKIGFQLKYHAFARSQWGLGDTPYVDERLKADDLFACLVAAHFRREFLSTMDDAHGYSVISIVSPNEGHALAALLELWRRAVEDIDFEARLAALEARQSEVRS